MAAAAIRKKGARNDTLPDPHEPLTRRQIAEERPVEWLRRVRQHVVDADFGELRLERLDVVANQLAILIAERFGHDGNLLAAFEILEARRVLEPEIEFGRIEHVKRDEIAPEKMQR